MNDTTASAGSAVRDVEREAREFLNYQLLPLHKVVARLEDGVAPAFPSRLLLPPDDRAYGRSGRRDDASGLADTDPELFAAVERLRRTPWFRLRFALVQLRRGGR